MINNKLENTIMSLIPSKTLKNAIKTTKHKFSDIELVQLIIEFAPSWERMILLLFETKKYIEDKKIKKFITQYINKEKKQQQEKFSCCCFFLCSPISIQSLISQNLWFYSMWRIRQITLYKNMFMNASIHYIFLYKVAWL